MSDLKEIREHNAAFAASYECFIKGYLQYKSNHNRSDQHQIEREGEHNDYSARFEKAQR